MEIKQIDDTIVCSMRYKSGFEQWFLLCSDVHIDSKYCKKNIFRRHLEEAKERNAKVLIAGDFFDLMQAKNDPRHNKRNLDTYDIQDTYFNSVIGKTFNFIHPYKEQLAMIGYGNHETASVKHSEVDVLKLFVTMLNNSGANITLGGYGGWIRFKFEQESGGGRQSYLMFYHHGSGSNAPMTKGLLNSVRASAFLPDADIIWTGHNHESWLVKQERYRVNDMNKTFNDSQYLLKSSTYYDDTEKGFGFLYEKLSNPKPIGAWWLRFYYANKNIYFEFAEAK